MRRSLSRELLLLSAPLIVVAAVALWASRRPKPIVPIQKKWRIESELAQHSPSPMEVRRGSDTQFRLKVHVLSPEDQTPTAQGSLWNDVRLVETDERGKERRVWDVNRYFYDFPSDDWGHIGQLSFGGGGGGRAEEWGMDYGFALRRLPHPTRHIELRVDSVWRPVVTRAMIVDATPGQVAQMRAMPDALSTSRRWVLRKGGQNTPTPRVSMDPSFDIRSVQFQSLTNELKEPCVRVKWHIFWRGPHRDEQRAHASLAIYDERNNIFTNTVSELGGDRNNGRNFSVWNDCALSFTRSRAKEVGSKSLFLRGWISVNGCWPRQVNLKLPDWVLKNEKSQPTSTK